MEYRGSGAYNEHRYGGLDGSDGREAQNQQAGAVPNNDNLNNSNNGYLNDQTYGYEIPYKRNSRYSNGGAHNEYRSGGLDGNIGRDPVIYRYNNHGARPMVPSFFPGGAPLLAPGPLSRWSRSSRKSRR
ncbi:hypothetical protein CC80DRAFT_506593 [Byssothecium circinans]|uniref:Uncharacterized protein n=1 Tax=Byssothecium circinans TaxID=147558 RepID=A0A6A5TN88_9PLEO|nr:hypothetical protein CC80DRAFT_506593 [Byssothecium circinans]